MKCYLSKKQRRTAIALSADPNLYISDSFMFDELPGITKRVAAAINRSHDPVRAVAITASSFEDNDSLLELLKLAATAADRSQQAGKSEAAGKPAVQGDAAKQAGKKPARNKKRSGDDDIDLTALFAE